MKLRLEDREQIRDVLSAYTHAIDRRSWDIMPQLFHDDAQFAFGTLTGDWRGFVDQARAVIDPCLATHHQLGQTVFGFESDTVCHTETYMTAMHTIPAGYPVAEIFPDKGKPYSAVIAGRYVDRFEKRATSDGLQWRLALRTGMYDWREFRVVEGVDLSELPADSCGGHGAKDPATPVIHHWLQS